MDQNQDFYIVEKPADDNVTVKTIHLDNDLLFYMVLLLCILEGCTLICKLYYHCTKEDKYSRDVEKV